MDVQTTQAFFTLTEVDTSQIFATITANAPIITAAAVGVIMVKKAIPLVPKMINKLIKI